MVVSSASGLDGATYCKIEFNQQIKKSRMCCSFFCVVVLILMFSARGTPAVYLDDDGNKMREHFVVSVDPQFYPLDFQNRESALDQVVISIWQPGGLPFPDLHFIFTRFRLIWGHI